MGTAQSERVRNGRSLGSQPLFTSLPQSVVAELERKLVFARHGAGSVIYRQGEETEGMFMVCSGRIKMWATTLHDRTALLRVARAGEVLNLANCLAGQPQLTTAEASENTSVAFLAREHLIKAVQNNPGFCQALVLDLAVSYIGQATETLSLRVPCSNAQRLAAVLLRLANGRVNGSAKNPRLIYTHAELAQLIGASRETVTRLMKRFADNAAIATGKSTFTIMDHRSLEETAEMT
jgi:CRP/FNR family cyclic AMP-dependent transcriptional regulator